MKVTDRLKQLIFKHLYKVLGNCEIIPYNNSIWFINRDNKYWYFELDKSGTLWWRYDFFNSFFLIFSVGSDDFCPVLSSWVEEVLNHKVSTTQRSWGKLGVLVEEVLNHKVSTTDSVVFYNNLVVVEVLNHKVSTTVPSADFELRMVEGALNCKVSTTESYFGPFTRGVEEVLNHKICTTDVEMSVMNYVMEQALNQ